MAYLNLSKSWTCQMCDMKSSNGWALTVLYGFNGWTQIVACYLCSGKLGKLGKLANLTKKNFGKPKNVEHQ